MIPHNTSGQETGAKARGAQTIGLYLHEQTVENLESLVARLRRYNPNTGG
jgi:hypothetical protein